MSKESEAARGRAEASFRPKIEQAAPMTEQQIVAHAVQEKTARLKQQRLAKEQADLAPRRV